MTTPLALTVAMDVDPVDHTTVPTLIGAPFWSSPVALAVAVWPTRIVAVESETTIVVNTGVEGVGVVGPAFVPPQPPPHAARRMLSASMPRADRASRIKEIAPVMERPL